MRRCSARRASAVSRTRACVLRSRVYALEPPTTVEAGFVCNRMGGPEARGRETQPTVSPLYTLREAPASFIPQGSLPMCPRVACSSSIKRLLRIAMYLIATVIHDIAIGPFSDTSQIRHRGLMHQRRMTDARTAADPNEMCAPGT